MLHIANVCLSIVHGGSEESALAWAEGLLGRRHEVHTVVTEGTWLSQALRDRKLRQVTVPRRSNRLDLRASLKIRSFLKRHPMDIVQAHRSQDLWAIYPALIGSATPRLFLILDRLPGGRSGRGVLDRLLYRKVSGIIVPTETGRRAVAAATPLVADRIAVIPLGYDPALYDLGPEARAAARAALGFQAGDIVVGALGRVGRERGQYELLEAARTVRRRHSALRLVIAGEALSTEGKKLLAFIRERVREYHMDEDVRVIVHPDNAPELLGALDIFVMPSLEETFSGPLAEAMLSRLACVGTESGGTPELLDDGKAGLLVPPGSAEGIARALATLFETPELRGILGRRAMDSARARFAIDNVMKQVENLYGGSGHETPR